MTNWVTTPAFRLRLQHSSALCSLLLRGVLVLIASSLTYGAGTEKGEVRQPRNIYELVYAFEHTFRKLLKGDELKLYETRTSKEIQAIDPELYSRISKDIQRWTDEWIQHIRTSGAPISEGRLNKANGLVERIEGILKQHFEARGWTYKPMRVVFIPPVAFEDDRDRGKATAGMFIPFYPDAFFATIDWPIPIELVLVHESLHFNASERPFGPALIEGITDAAARDIVLKYELLTPGELRRAGTYPREREAVEYILERIMQKTTRNRDEALDLFVEAYLTGRQDEMTRIFGATAWGRALSLSSSAGSWKKANLEKVLGEKPPEHYRSPPSWKERK